MGLLLGLPLRLLGLVAALVRIALLPAAILLAVWLWRRHRPGSAAGEGEEKAPHFKGPVYTVDYKEVKDDGEHKD